MSMKKMRRRVILFSAAAIGLGHTATSFGQTTYNSEAAFLAAAGSLSLESFETAFPAGSSHDFGPFTIAYGGSIIHDNSFHATDGTGSVRWDNNGTSYLTFTFDTPITRFGINFLGYGTTGSPSQLQFATNASFNAVIAAVSSDRSGELEDQFGFISATPVTTFSIRSTAINDTMYLDEVRWLTTGGGNWITSAGGSWNAGSNWSTGAQPSSAEDANFNLSSTYTVTASSAAAANNININAGTITLDLGANTLTAPGTTSVFSGSQLKLASGTLSVGSLDTGGNRNRFYNHWTGGTLNIMSSPLVVATGATAALRDHIALTSGRALLVQSLDHAATNANGTISLDGALLAQTDPAGFTLLGGSGFNAFVELSNSATFTSAATIKLASGGSALTTGTFNVLSGSRVTAPSLTITERVVSSSQQAAAMLVDSARVEITNNLIAAGTLSGAGNGRATLTIQNNGSVAVGGTTKIWGGGTLNLSSGSLSTGGLDMSGDGAFNFTGGTVNAGTLEVDNGNLFNFSGGTFNLNGPGNSYVAGQLQIGDGIGAATFNQSGGTHEVGLDLNIGQDNGSSGTYLLSGDSLLTVFGQVYIGVEGNATFNQNGGVHTVDNQLFVASSGSNTGIYLLSGTASLTVNGEEHIGHQGAGTFTQSGGLHTANSILALGSGPSASGTYLLSGGGSLSVGDNEIVGYFGSGTFNQTGGTHTAHSNLYLGFLGGSTGAYLLSGSGSLSVSGSENVGYFGSSTFHQSGGTHTAGLLSLGVLSGSTGNFQLSGGSFSVIGYERVGDSGAGTFNQGGGTHTVNSDLFIGYNGGSAGTFLLSGGALNVGGDAGIGGDLNFAGGSGELNISGGAAAVAGTTKIHSSGKLIFTGGAFSTGSLIVQGGDLLLSPGSDKLIRTGSLSISAGGLIDLSDNDMLIDYNSLGSLPANLRGYLQSGSLTSTAASSYLRLGYADNALLHQASFDGIVFPANDFTQLLVKYTYAGDATLDGQVDIRDLQMFIQNFNGTNQFWSDGDFDYDGDVDRADLSFLARNWQAGVGNPLGGSFSDALQSLGVAIPEPSNLALAGITLMLARRRRYLP